MDTHISAQRQAIPIGKAIEEGLIYDVPSVDVSAEGDKKPEESKGLSLAEAADKGLIDVKRGDILLHFLNARFKYIL